MSLPVSTLQVEGDAEAGLRSASQNADSNHHGRRGGDEQELAKADDDDVETEDEETEDDETLAVSAGSPSTAGAPHDSPRGASPSATSLQRRKCTRCPETDPAQFTVVQQGEYRRWLKQCNACRAKARTTRRMKRQGHSVDQRLVGLAGTEQPCMSMGSTTRTPFAERSEMLYLQPELGFSCVNDVMVEDTVDDLAEPGSVCASTSAHGPGEVQDEGEGEDDDQDVDPAEAALRLALAALARGASANASAGASSWSWHDPLDAGKTGTGDSATSSAAHAAGDVMAASANAKAACNGKPVSITIDKGQSEPADECQLEEAQVPERSGVTSAEAGEHEGAPPSGPPSGSMMLWLAVRKRLWQRQRTARHMLRSAMMLREYVDSRATEQADFVNTANLKSTTEVLGEDKIGAATVSGKQCGARHTNGPGTDIEAACETVAKTGRPIGVMKGKSARLNKEQLSAFFHSRRQTFQDQRAQRWPWQAISRRHSSGLALDNLMSTISEAIKAPGTDADSARVRESLVEQQLRVLDGLGIELERFIELFQIVLKRLPARWWFGATSHSSPATAIADAVHKRCETQLTISAWMGRQTSGVRRFDADTQTFYFKEYEVLVKALASVLGRGRFRELMRVAAGALAAQQHRELELGWHGKGTTARAERARMAAALRMRRRDVAQQRLAVQRAYAHARQLQRERMQAARLRNGSRHGGQSRQRPARGMTKKEQSAQARISKAQLAKQQLEEDTASALARMRMGEFEVQFDHGLLGLSFIWCASPSPLTSTDNNEGPEASLKQLRDGERVDIDETKQRRELKARGDERRNGEALTWGTYLVCGTDPWLQLARSDAIATGLEACGFGEVQCAYSASRPPSGQLLLDSRPKRIGVGHRGPRDWASYLAGRPSVGDCRKANECTSEGQDVVLLQPKRRRKITHGSDQLLPTAREHLFGFASVLGVTAGAQGQHSPVLPGDRLVAVNGVPCSTTSFHNVVSQIADARTRGQRLRLRFHRILMPMGSEGNTPDDAITRREDRKRRGKRKKPAGFTVDHSKWGLHLSGRSVTRAGVRAGAKLVFMPTFDMSRHLTMVTRGWGHYLTGREAQPLEKLSLRKSREMQRRDASIFHGVSMLTASGTGIASLHHYEARAPLPVELRRDPNIQDPREKGTVRPKREKANANRLGPALVTASSGTNFNTVFLGVFNDECNAARAYDRAVYALHGSAPPPDVPTNEALLSEVERIGYLKATTYARKEISAQRRDANRKRGSSANKRVPSTKRDRPTSKAGAPKSKLRKGGALSGSSAEHASQPQAASKLTERAETQVREQARTPAELQKKLVEIKQRVSPGKDAAQPTLHVHELVHGCGMELSRGKAVADQQTGVGRSLKRKPKPKSKPKLKRTRLST